MNSLFSIKINKNEEFVKKLVFSQEPEVKHQIKYNEIIKIGKMSTSHIKLNDDNVSRMHGIIEFNDENFSITVMSKNKTILNNKILEQNKRVILNDKDVLKIGNLEIIFYFNIDIFYIDDVKKDYIINLVEKTPKIIKNSEETINLIDSELENIKAVNINETYFAKNDDETILKDSIGKGIDIKHYWRGNLIDSKLFKAKTDIVTIGANENDTFYLNPIFLPNKTSFNILKNINQVQFLPFNVKYIENNESYNLKELISSKKANLQNNYGKITLKYKTKIAFEIDENRFEISHIPLYKTTGKSIFSPILDGLNVKFSAFSALIHIMAILLVSLIPAQLEMFNIEKLNNVPERYAKIILNVPKLKIIKKNVKFKERLVQKDIKFDKNSNNYSNIKLKSQNIGEKLSQKQRKIKSIVNKSGILNSKLSNQLGVGTYGGLEDDKIILSDNVDINSTTNGTPNIRGGVSGSGGPSGNTLGSGGPNTNGYSGRNTKNSIAIHGPKKRRKGIIARTGPSEFIGNLTRQQIQRVVNKNIAQIRYCYENELLRKPKLKGNITLSWIINPQGKVKSVKVTGATLKDKNVLNCMMKRVKRWKFPEPKGGGYSKILYPFNFRSN